MSIFRTKITLQSTSGTLDFSGFAVGSTPQVLWNPLDSTFDAGQTVRKILLDNAPFNQAISTSTLVMNRDGVELSKNEAYQTFYEITQIWSQVDSAASAFTLLKVNKANGYDDVAKIKLDALADTDGRQITTNWPVGLGWRTWVVGASDDETPPIEATGRGTGNEIMLDFTGSGTLTTDISFSEVVQIKNGFLFFEPVSAWSGRDRCSVGVIIPANSSSIASGLDGNVVAVPQYGGIFNIYVPPHVAGLPGGTHMIDMASAVPVPAQNKDGYWNMDTDTGVITPIAPGATPTADYHLIDLEQSFFIVKNVPMPGHIGHVTVISEKVEPIHPSWKLFSTVKRVSSGSGLVTGMFHAFRRNVQ